MSPQRRPLGLLPVAAAGLGVFGLGLWAASARLPEWRVGKLPPPSVFVQRFSELAAAADVTLLADPPTVRLISRSEPHSAAESSAVYETLGGRAADWLAEQGLGVEFEVGQLSRLPGGVRTRFEILFSARGAAQSAQWVPVGFAPLSREGAAWPDRSTTFDSLRRILLQPGETLAPAQEIGVFATTVSVSPIVGSNPPQYIGMTAEGAARTGGREVGTLETARKVLRQVVGFSLWGRVIYGVILFIAATAAFLWLLARRRLDLRNAALITGAVFLASTVGWLQRWTGSLQMISFIVGQFFVILFLFLLWSAAESWIRSRDAEFRTSLDILRSGRVGPRGGRALLAGSAMGAASAGANLSLFSLTATLPGLSPGSTSVAIPSYKLVGSAVMVAALVLGAIALAATVASKRYRPWTAVVIAALLLLPRASGTPLSVKLLFSFLTASILVFAYERFGLAAMLVGSLAAYLFPLVVFSAEHLDWIAGAFLGSATTLAAFLVLGLVGLRRSPDAEVQRLAPPAFVRRLEEERRLKYEMDLLAKMQVRLLPEKPPPVPGYEISAQSVLATEVGGDLYDFLQDEKGGLWIAAGDVAGHGFSCSIAQAMTKAALSSLIAADRPPSQVLRDVDRVLRRSGSPRNFTSLALLRLNLQSGEASLSNAGHPFPLFFANGEVRELVSASLPLGQGPDRQYWDSFFHLEPGGVLVFLSDGLIEGRNAAEEPYGFDRPRELLRSLVRRPADAILEALLADWRRHVGPEAPADDTTLVVLKRILGSSASVPASSSSS